MRRATAGLILRYSAIGLAILAIACTAPTVPTLSPPVALPPPPRVSLAETAPAPPAPAPTVAAVLTPATTGRPPLQSSLVRPETPFVQLTAGGRQFCGLQDDGAALCWTPASNAIADGSRNAPDSTAENPLLQPATSEKFQQIAAGGDFFCGLLDDGAVQCSYSPDGIGAVPEGNFTAIAAGSRHACALDADGKAVCWGRSTDAVATADDAGRTTPPPDASFVAIAAGGAHSCGLTVDASLLCWGQNPDGRADPQTGPFRQLALGANHTCALRPDGTAFCQGDDASGQSRPPATPFTQIALGREHGCGVTAAGAIQCWGAGWAENGAPAGEFTAVSVGENSVCGLRPAGSAECWGPDPAPFPYYLTPASAPAPGLSHPELAAVGIYQPVDLFSWPDGRLAVVDRKGAIVLFAEGTEPQLVLDLSDRVDGRWETGLFSAALDPDFPESPFLYVYYTNVVEPDGSEPAITARLARFPVSDAGVASPPDELVILELPKQKRHHGGAVRFGPDQMLYLGIGDDFEWRTAADLSLLYGKIIRIEMRGATAAQPYRIPPDNPFIAQSGANAAARPEIWAYGLRNPWRMSFDSQGRLWVADVGGDYREELSIATAGAHLGWPIFEGDVCHQRRTEVISCKRPSSWPDLTFPVYQYDADAGDCAITGVLANTRYDGIVLVADLCSGRVWALTGRAGSGWHAQELGRYHPPIYSLAADASGAVYILTAGRGGILRLELSE